MGISRDQLVAIITAIVVHGDMTRGVGNINLGISASGALQIVQAAEKAVAEEKFQEAIERDKEAKP